MLRYVFDQPEIVANCTAMMIPAVVCEPVAAITAMRGLGDFRSWWQA